MKVGQRKRWQDDRKDPSQGRSRAGRSQGHHSRQDKGSAGRPVTRTPLKVGQGPAGHKITSQGRSRVALAGRSQGHHSSQVSKEALKISPTNINVTPREFLLFSHFFLFRPSGDTRRRQAGLPGLAWRSSSPSPGTTPSRSGSSSWAALRRSLSLTRLVLLI